MKNELDVFRRDVDHRFTQVHSEIRSQVKESEFRVITTLGFLTISTTSIAVAILTWLIKI